MPEIASSWPRLSGAGARRGRAGRTRHLAGARFHSAMYRALVQGPQIAAVPIFDDLFHRGAAAGLTTSLLLTAHTDLAVYQNRFRVREG
jgi:hypothetical protein